MITKVTKTQLKSIVKECLFEIFQEMVIEHQETDSGKIKESKSRNFSAAVAPARAEKRKVEESNLSKSYRPRTASLDTPFSELLGLNKQKSKSQNMSVFDGIDESNPILGESSDAAGKNSLSFAEQINGTPDEIFGSEVSSKWADLAFADSRNVNR